MNQKYYSILPNISKEYEIDQKSITDTFKIQWDMAMFEKKLIHKGQHDRLEFFKKIIE